MSLGVNGQEVPPIEYYSPEDYKAENQNWAIGQSHNKFIYVANNKGLLEFNGATWQLYPSPNETIIRSVKANDNRIYIGCYMEFGFWSKNNNDQLQYTSLSSKLKHQLIEDEQFWQIEESNNKILFRSFNRIYIYHQNTDEIKIIDSNSSILKIFKLDEIIYFQNADEGIFKFENGSAKLIYTKGFLQDNEIINFFKIDESLIFVSQLNGLFTVSGSNFEKLIPQNHATNTNSTIYSAIKLRDDSIVLGTIGNGIIHLNSQGNLHRPLNQSNGIGNNTILSLFEDVSGNVWLGLDNGINVINLDSQFSFYSDEQGFLGTIYTSLFKDDLLYIGTNQGLFYRNVNNDNTFTLIEGTQGQVWYIKEIDGTVFCGHNLGTFIIEGLEAQLQIKELGAWDLMPINENLMLQGNFSGLYVLEKQSGRWQLRNKIENFDISSRDFEIVGNNVLVNHEYKGVYKLELDDNFTKAITVKEIEDIGKSIHSGLTKYNGEIIYSKKEGIYKFQENSNTFIKDENLSQLYKPSEYISGRLILDKKQRLWSFTKDDIRYLAPNSLSKEPIIKRIPIEHSVRKEMIAFENILHLKSDKYLYGTSKGYLLFDLDKETNEVFDIYLNEVNIYDRNNVKLEVTGKEISELAYKSNNIEFVYSVPEYSVYLNTEFRYRLNGYNDNWSKWQDQSSVLFKNLPSGSYTFLLEARVGGNKVDDHITYIFSIKKPWYISNLLIGIYVLLIVLFSILMHLLYTNYYRKQEKELLLKNQRELALRDLEFDKQRMAMSNEQLQQDIENKNRELAISTMSLIKKNEFLSEIKKELSSQSDSQSTKKILKIIDKKLDTDDDWKFFEEAFNNADKDFLRKIKDKHPSLTPSDLRLCAYLRLNLSSKEIAPLLNITYRSIEIKRYRLRKKMELQHETSLTEYILSI